MTLKNSPTQAEQEVRTITVGSVLKVVTGVGAPKPELISVLGMAFAGFTAALAEDETAEEPKDNLGD